MEVPPPTFFCKLKKHNISHFTHAVETLYSLRMPEHPNTALPINCSLLFLPLCPSWRSCNEHTGLCLPGITWKSQKVVEREIASVLSLWFRERHDVCAMMVELEAIVVRCMISANEVITLITQWANWISLFGGRKWKLQLSGITTVPDKIIKAGSAKSNPVTNEKAVYLGHWIRMCCTRKNRKLRNRHCK